MPALKRLQWSVDIAAPASMVYQMLVGPESYAKWTSAFGEGLYFEGSWQRGQRIRFLTPEGHGVTSEIAVHRRPDAYIFDTNLWFLPIGVHLLVTNAWLPAKRTRPVERPGTAGDDRPLLAGRARSGVARVARQLRTFVGSGAPLNRQSATRRTPCRRLARCAASVPRRCRPSTARRR
jgi:hypothetical protein